jgi:hypothetical protein
MLGGQSAALASPGCTAFNGSFSGGVVAGNITGAGFSAGDIITITVTAAGGGDALGLYNDTTHTPILASTNAAGARTYSVPADTNDAFLVSGTRANAGSNFTWSCVAGGGSTGSTPSEKLASVQTTGSTVAATTSATNIAGSVGGATAAALGGSSGPVGGASGVTVSADEFAEETAVKQLHGARPGPGVPVSITTAYYRYFTQALSYYATQVARGYTAYRTSSGGIEWRTSTGQTLQFASEASSNVSQRADEAFAALGYAAVNKAPAGRVFVPLWTPWLDVRGTGYEQSDSSALKGTQVNATGGLTYKFSPTFVAGVYAGFETFKYDFAALNGSLKGNGGSIGTYAGWQITPTLRWNGMVGWTGVSYDGSAGTASGSFSGSRWIASTGLTGSYRVSSVIVEPSASIFALTERQTGYTDTLAVVHASRTFSNGRVSLGGKVSAAPGLFAGFTPYVGLYGDWAFMSNNAVPVNVSSTGLSAGWSARTTAGVSVPVFTRSTLALGGELGGLGASYKTWTGNARLSVPF